MGRLKQREESDSERERGEGERKRVIESEREIERVVEREGGRWGRGGASGTFSDKNR